MAKKETVKKAAPKAKKETAQPIKEEEAATVVESIEIQEETVVVEEEVIEADETKEVEKPKKEEVENKEQVKRVNNKLYGYTWNGQIFDL